MAGWNVVHWDIDFMAIGTGMKFRIGKWNDPINFLFGAEYTYIIYNDENEDYDWEDSDIATAAHTIEIPIGLRINLFNAGTYNKIYIGCNAAFGFNIAKGDNVDVNKQNLSIEPQVGIASKHLDLGIYYKKNLKNRGIFKYSNDYKQRIGCFITWFI